MRRGAVGLALALAACTAPARGSRVLRSTPPPVAAAAPAPASDGDPPFATLSAVENVADLAVVERGREVLRIIITCEGDVPQLWIANARVELRGAPSAAACQAVWSAAVMAVASADCGAADAPHRACVDVSEDGRAVTACCVPGANPRFDEVAREFVTLGARTPTIQHAAFDQ